MTAPNEPKKPEDPVWISPVSPRDSSSKKYWVLSYFGILWLVGLLADRGNPRTRFHVNQGILLSALSTALGILNAIWHAVFNAIFGVWAFGEFLGVRPVGVLLNTLFSVAVSAVLLFYFLVGLVHAVRGQEKPLPLIGRLFTVVK